jgi:YbgC/YbaW family acyl-CoA thioester hydrolase
MPPTSPSSSKLRGSLRDGFRFFHRMRVRWAEVDMQRIVFNGHYLLYADTAMGEFWRALAMPYEDVTGRFGGDLFVKKATVEYDASAHYDDELDVGIRVDRIGTSSMSYGFAVFRQSERLVHGELVYVFADAKLQKSKPIPLELRAVYERFASGAPMTSTRLGSWTEVGPDALALRMKVFVEEQGIDESLERDEHDAASLHCVVSNSYGRPLATGRLLPDGHIGRIATESAMRGGGYAKLVMGALEEAALKRGQKQTILSAQTYAQGFYEKLGYVAQGNVYDDAGIAHIDMSKKLG